MADMAIIASVLTSLKTATDLTKLLREADSSFTISEWKLKLAGITDALAEARLSLAEIKELMIEKEEEIKRLTDAIEQKKNITKIDDAYYETDETGVPKGDPYCVNCWESKHVLRHLTTDSKNYRERQCPACKSSYSSRNTHPIKDQAETI